MAATPMDTGEVDEKLYSRQLYVMGHEAQRRMMASNVVLVGCGGLGVEVAKNGILAGLHSLTVMDPRPATWLDMGANFYLTAEHVASKKRKDEACVKQLKELNPYVQVTVSSAGEWTLEAMLTLIQPGEVTPSCVVVSDVLPNDWLYAINDQCRKIGCKFLYAVANGLFGRVFADLGDAHVINDPDGNPPASSQIETVLMENPAVVKTLEDQRHGLETGDVVQLGRLKGLDGVLEVKKDYKVKVTGPYTFELEGVDLSGKTSTETSFQGYITQVKQPKTMSFKTYKEKMEDPGEFVLSDFAKFDRPQLLHLGFKALTQFAGENGGKLPGPADEAAANKILEMAEALSEEPFTDAQKRILKFYALGAQAQLSPMCAALGGMVGQEVLKACSGKFTPLNGFFYLDADECLPDEVPDMNLLKPTGSRYDSQICVFGKDMQEKFLDLRYFIVGAGAIGCEMLKNWALMGVGCGGNGHVHVTDMDRIEKSNLSRQFLFRNTDINEFKSTTAAKACQVMNPDFRVTAYQEKVAPDTEHLFGDDFYDKLSGVCTALDNVEARLYVDQRCLFYRLPMLESGTLGTKGNTQIVVPHVTENYGATRDPPEKSIPVCTLKNFPNMIQHTLQWGRDWFEGAFRQSAEEVNAYLSTNPTQYLEGLQQNSKVETLSLIRKTLVDERPVSFEDCVVWARLQFETLFNNQIRQLLHNFPEDQLTSSGTKFWSGSKRCPKPLVFDLDDICEDAGMRNHLDFVVAASNLRAEMYGIKGRTDEEYFRKVLKDVIVPDFSPAEGVRIAANDAEEQKNNDAAMDGGEGEANEIWKSLPGPSELAGFRLHPIEFDKDLDDHAGFIAACSNLRAMNYSIPTEDLHRSRAIAGRIIPAIATTTALVTGLICFELYKIMGTPRKELKIDAYKSAFANLAIPFMTLSEPSAPAKTKAMLKGKEWEWTPWDSLDVNQGNMTLGEFMKFFEKEYGLEISMLSYGVSILYSFFANKKKVEERKAMRMTDVITSISKKEFPPNQLFIILEVIANDKETDEEVELPYIRFRFR
ncbi:Ubiquitin-activating enzyme E1 1 [Seminavis robusta]|uniref:E1 ubiquitin-activating enzyme n=1 Tax=Seminavis robusta TaxID=568900 RepID=A0A9N8H7G3_9STRA|nr:Ubiquitin-activating enzyme E1 1 [Seminavis robusta]|eukprot:Sro128_g061270.1 Ubiquitin-activating enzyme E1 1 (1042) ;mRNA; f:67575-71012